MASSAVRAYGYRAPQEMPRRDSHVGIVRGIPQRGISPSAIRAAKLFMAGIAVFAVLAFVRIGFTTATVSTMISSQAVAAQISETTSANASLSVQKSVLGSPSAVKERAGALGMAEAAGVETIALAPDVVAYDGAGNLSLSASLSHAA